MSNLDGVIQASLNGVQCTTIRNSYFMPTYTHCRCPNRDVGNRKEEVKLYNEFGNLKI